MFIVANHRVRDNTGDDAEMSVRPSTEHGGAPGNSLLMSTYLHRGAHFSSAALRQGQGSSVQVPAQALACRVLPPEPATWTLGLTLLQSTAQQGLWLARPNLEGIKAALRPRVVESH